MNARQQLNGYATKHKLKVKTQEFFAIQLQVGELACVGYGKSKKEAKEQAAEKLLAAIDSVSF